MIKKHFKKLVSLALTAIMVMGMSVTAFADEPQHKLTDEILLSLSSQDYNECYDYLLQYKKQNPNCTDDDLNEIATSFYIQKANEPSPFDSSYDNLLMDATGMNSEELALAKKYPSDIAAIYSSANIAQSQADSRYNSGAYLGNKDAFRHTAWNALIICRFYALGKGNYSWCSERTRLWTTAHENGSSKQSGQTSAQFAVDKEMDILNNAAGRAAAETTYTSEGLALQKVQQYIDNGWCKRIKTDAQMGYSKEQMFAIPTWTLRSTNTCFFSQ